MVLYDLLALVRSDRLLVLGDALWGGGGEIPVTGYLSGMSHGPLLGQRV